jgi:deoxyribodipyrimidine photolyase-related protein
MSSAFLLFPVHLFKNIALLKKYKNIYIIEEPRYFTDFKFHKLKLAYHRASMKYYYDYLKKHKCNITYIEYKSVNSNFYKLLTKKYKSISAYDPNDFSLESILLSAKVEVVPTQNFSISREMMIQNLNIYYNSKSKKFNFMNFYKMMRTKLNILVTKSGNPEGGKWSFDEDNRKSYPVKNGPKIPDLPKVDSKNKYIKEAILYIEKHFPNHYGSLDYFIYPITHEESRKWCENFCKDRFKNFGTYQDAIITSDKKDVILNSKQEDKIKNSEFMFHSVLSPMMNIGLITDSEVLDIVLKYQKQVPLSAFEGFIRQVIGWRNYICMIYTTKYGNPEMSIPNYYKYINKMNFMKHKNKLPYKHFWGGTTNILPVDDAIQTIIKYGYVHHIQRLMVLGNVMLLMKIQPNDVFKIFMEWTVDAYEWVMTGNVYGMTQHADGGIIMTRPYFSSSNYIKSMSNYKCGSDREENWCKIWDSLYGSFIEKHSAYLKRNYSTARMVTFYLRKSEKEKSENRKIVNKYMKSF